MRHSVWYEYAVIPQPADNGSRSSTTSSEISQRAAGTDIKFNQTIETISLTEDGKRL